MLEGTIDVATHAALAGLGEATGTLAEPGTGWWFAEETLRHRQDPVFWSLQTGAPIGDAGVLQAMALGSARLSFPRIRGESDRFMLKFMKR